MMVLVLAVAAVVVIAIARLGTAADEAAQARTAADAAALAAAAQGFAAAAELAEANGAALVDYSAFGNQVEVRVRVGSAVAVARAERSVVWEHGSGGGRQGGDPVPEPSAASSGNIPLQDELPLHLAEPSHASGTVPERRSPAEAQSP